MHMFLFKKDECITKTVVPETNNWRLFLGYWNSSDEVYGFWELQKLLRVAVVTSYFVWPTVGLSGVWSNLCY